MRDRGKWSLLDMKVVLVAGQCALFLASLSLILFRDPPQAMEGAGQDKDGAESSMATDVRLSSRRAFGVLRPSHVPLIITVSDLFKILGAGMTLTFLDLWLVNDY